jgi:hypothetical protein
MSEQDTLPAPDLPQTSNNAPILSDGIKATNDKQPPGGTPRKITEHGPGMPLIVKILFVIHLLDFSL